MERLNQLQFDFHNYLLCPKCNLMIENPYELECCGILFCYDCIKHIRPDQEKCSKCNRVCLFRQNSFVKRISNQMILNCGFNCGHKFSFTEIRNHMITCEMREYICNMCIENKNAKPSFKGNKKDLLIHIMNTHENELLHVNDKYLEFKSNINKKEKDNEKINYNYIEDSINENEPRNLYHYNDQEENSSYESDLNENYSGSMSGVYN